MSVFWSGVLFGAFSVWIACEWFVFVMREIEAKNARRRQVQQFRQIEACAVIVAQRLTDSEKAEINMELYR